MESVVGTLRIALIFQIMFFGLVFIRNWCCGRIAGVALALLAGVMSHQLIPLVQAYELEGMVPFLSIGEVAVPFFFWLITRAIFDDHFHFGKREMIMLLVVELISMASYFLVPRPSVFAPVMLQGLFPHLVYGLPLVLAGVFPLASLWLLFISRGDDLVEPRRRLRLTYVIFTGFFILSVPIVSLVPAAAKYGLVIGLLDVLPPLLSLYYFGVRILVLDAVLFSQVVVVPVVIPPSLAENPQAYVEIDEALHTRLIKAMEQDHFYREEGLTIGMLANYLDVGEHQLRRLINGQLGFRNFNDYLNRYRIREACQLLVDPSHANQTVADIAYSLGYRSLSPFNRAFRELAETTPTAYRKRGLELLPFAEDQESRL